MTRDRGEKRKIDFNPKTARDGYSNTDKKKLLDIEEQLKEE